MQATAHAHGGDHRVELYESDDHLARSVAAHLAPALLWGEAAIAIATPEHRVAIRAALAVAGVDVAAAEDVGRLVLLDARATLGTFLVDDRPHPGLFLEHVGEVVVRAAGRFGGVRAFGEMVALLWADGQVPAAIELEDRWNDLAEVCDFSLLCAYPVTAFGPGSAAGFRTVCDQHGAVLPTERHTRLDERQRDRHVAELQVAVQRLEARDRDRAAAVAKLVHDIRTPVCVVQGFAQLLAERWAAIGPDERLVMLERCSVGATSIREVAEAVLSGLDAPEG